MKQSVSVPVLLIFAVMALPSAGIASAGPAYRAFQSPSGNVYCGLSESLSPSDAIAMCEIRDHTWMAPPRATQHMGDWGDRVSMQQGDAPHMSCHTDTVKDPGSPVLAYGQSRSLNSLTCNSEISGMTCTDNGTGHFFRISRDNYELH